MSIPKKLFLLGALLLALDQLTKLAVRTFFHSSSSLQIIPNLFYLTYSQNTGALFGSFKGGNELLIWIALMAIGLILYLWDQFPKESCSAIFLTFILAGSLGNLIDRVFLGYVTDFLDFRIWPVFNLADSLVTIGIVGMVIIILKEGAKSGKEEPNKTYSHKIKIRSKK